MQVIATSSIFSLIRFILFYYFFMYDGYDGPAGSEKPLVLLMGFIARERGIHPHWVVMGYLHSYYIPLSHLYFIAC